MDDLEIVQVAQSTADRLDNVPHFTFWKFLETVSLISDAVGQITLFAELHDHTEGSGFLVIEGVIVLGQLWGVDGCQ